VEEVEHVTHHGLELADEGDRVEDHRTGSKPPWLHGLQRSSRQPARALPRTRPWRRSACTAYSEHEGWYLQVVGKSAPNVSRYSQTRPIPSSPGTRVTTITPPRLRSARAARRRVRRASRSRSPRRPPRAPAGRSTRSRARAERDRAARARP